jgi:hypothetical protein
MKRLAAFASLVAACAGPRDLPFLGDVPDDTEFVAALALDKDGQVLSSTGLIRRTSDGQARLFLAPPSTPDMFELIAYPEPSLAPILDGVSDQRLWSSALSPAREDQRPLPRPSFARLYSPSGEAIGEAPVRALTASWMPPCPEVVSSTAAPFADLDCAFLPCTPVVRQQGCSISIDSVACGLSDLGGTIDVKGRVSFDQPEAFESCVQVELRKGSILSADCTKPAEGGCRLDVRRRGIAPAVRWKSQRLEGLPYFQDIGFSRVPVGYTSGLVMLDGKLVVGLNGGVYGNRYCPPERRSRFAFVDPETLAVTATVAAPECTVQIAKDPTGPGFLAAHGGPVRLISRFDAQGNLQMTRAIDAPPLDADHWIFGIYTSADPPRILTAFNAEVRPGRDTATGYMADVDPETLELRALTGNIAGRVEVYGTAGPGKVAATEELADSLRVYEPGLDRYELLSLWGLCSRARRISPYALVRQDSTGFVVLPAAGTDVQALFALDLDPMPPRCAAVSSWEVAADATAAIEWPEDRSLVLVGLVENRMRAFAALADTRARRFLPGAVEIGRGQVSDPVSDGRRVFLLLPWSAEIVRVEP